MSADDLFPVYGRSSGLPMNIVIGGDGVYVQMDHRERFDRDRLVRVSIEANDPLTEARALLDATDLDLVRRYIALNRAAIMDHGRGLTDGLELAAALERLP